MRSDPIRVDAALPVALCVCAALAWIAGVLLLTRQSGWLLLLMAGTVPGGIPHRGDMKLFWDESNWQPLCESCHNQKTGRGM